MTKMVKPRAAKAAGAGTTTKDSDGKVPVVVGYARNVLTPTDITSMEAKAKEVAAEIELFVDSTFHI